MYVYLQHVFFSYHSNAPYQQLLPSADLLTNEADQCDWSNIINTAKKSLIFAPKQIESVTCELILQLYVDIWTRKEHNSSYYS